MGEGSRDIMALYWAHEARLRSFVRSLVANRDDAEDVFQQAVVTMLEKYEGVGEVQDFPRWACRIVAYKVMELRKLQKRERMRFSDATLEALVRDGTDFMADATDIQVALDQCLDKLRPAHRAILLARYQDCASVEDIATTTGRTMDAIYRSLSRCRRILHDCVSIQVARMGASQ